MKIAIDIMGGDFAPLATTKGAMLALEHLAPADTLVLIGDEKQILPIIEEIKPKHTNFEILHTEEFIEMGEHPTKAYARKQNSSIALGFQLLRDNKIEGFASAGNTGAMLVGSKLSLAQIPGIIRPCVVSMLPKANGKLGVLLDVGTNVDCKPEMLVQFALLGQIISKNVHGIDNPKIALLNVGEEEGKGNALSIQVFNMLKENQNLNFVGNVEGRDLFNDKADVIVCDGFTGNIAIKLAESIFYMMKKRGISDEYFDQFNYERYGGSPVLGVDGNVVIGHGISNATAIKNMILLMKEMATVGLVKKIKNTFISIHEQSQS
jgi:glycerol-3-phosphate acyltransferase PlsX